MEGGGGGVPFFRRAKTSKGLGVEGTQLIRIGLETGDWLIHCTARGRERGKEGGGGG